MVYLIILFVAVVGVIVTWFLSKKIHLLDKPYLYADTKGKRSPIPTVQGFFLYFIFGLIIAIFFPSLLQQTLVIVLLVGAGLMMLMGFLDDVAIGVRMPSRVRLLLQILISGAVVRGADLARLQTNFLGRQITFGPYWGAMISILWFLLCINGINRFDGINGQASGISSIGLLTIGILLFAVVIPSFPDISLDHLKTLTTITTLSLLLGGLVLLYTIMEWKPRGLVRDAGSLLYGFALAYLSLAGGAKIGTVVVVLSLVIFDAIWVVINRIFVMKKVPRKGDFTHLHHRLLSLGRSKKEITIFSWSRSLVMMMLMLLQGSNRIHKVIIFIMMAVVFFGVNAYIFRYKYPKAGLKVKKEV